MLSADIGLVVILIIVWVLVAVLTKVYFNPVRKVMQDRDRGINKDREAGEKAVQEYEQTIQRIDAEIKKTKTSTFAIREKYKQEALQEKEQMLMSVSRECRAQVNQAKKELDEQLKKLKTDLQAESDLLAKKIKQRLLH